MRHGKKFNHLGRTSEHRKAMLANQAISLIEHKKIVTTIAKAKALRKYVEPILTKSKSDTTHSRRIVFSYLKNKEAIKELFGEISGKIMDRPGGYTRILKTGYRQGDNAEMCVIELVDFNENLLTSAPKKQEKKKVRRGGVKKTTSGKTPASGKSKAAENTDPAEKAKSVKASGAGESTEPKKGNEPTKPSGGDEPAKPSKGAKSSENNENAEKGE